MIYDHRNSRPGWTIGRNLRRLMSSPRRKIMLVGSYVRARLCDLRYRDVSAAELERLVNIPTVHKGSEDIVPVASLPLDKRQALLEAQ